MEIKRHFFITLIAIIMFTLDLSAQEVFGLSFQYENFPSSRLADPDEEMEDLEITTRSYSIKAAFPVSFAKGNVIVFNSIKYDNVGFEYEKLPPGSASPDYVHAIEYTAFIIDSLSSKWSMVAVLTPGIASDFESKLTMDDFTFQGVFGFLRKFSKKFSLGSGIAYTREFGPSIPLPFIYFEWAISPKLNAQGLLPQNLDLLYKYNSKLDLGLSVGVSGNRYHGSPVIYGVSNPQMEYSEGTVSPKIQIHFSEMFHLNLEGGYVFYRNFEFLNGSKSVKSYDMENTGYLRTSFVFGM